MASGVYQRIKPVWNKGKKRPPFSEEWKRKIGIANTGKKRSEEYKLKSSLTRLGKARAGTPKNWKHTEETKRRLSKAHKGKVLSEEHKRRISEIHKKNGLKPPIRYGAANHFWKGGISRAYKTGYWSTEYKKWRITVFERDGYKCQGCKKVGGYLTAHHIKSFAHYPKLRFDLDNGITLCEDCHKLTDNYAGREHKKV